MNKNLEKFKKNEQDKDFKKQKNMLIIGILFALIILIGSAYAFFTYSKTVSAFTLVSGDIEASFVSGTNAVEFQNAYPISDTYAISNLSQLTYIDFIVSSDVKNSNQAVKYEVYLTEDENNTLNNNYIKLYLTDNNNNQVVKPTLYSSLSNTTYSKDSTGKVIYSDSNTGQFSKDYRLYVWLDSNYSQNQVSQTFSFKINLYAYNDVVNN